jgi:hypothetical protein
VSGAFGWTPAAAAVRDVDDDDDEVIDGCIGDSAAALMLTDSELRFIGVVSLNETDVAASLSPALTNGVVDDDDVAVAADDDDVAVVVVVVVVDVVGAAGGAVGGGFDGAVESERDELDMRNDERGDVLCVLVRVSERRRVG